MTAKHLLMTAPAAGGGLTIVAEDTFTRANSTTLGSTEVGSFAWTESIGDMKIESNGLKVASYVSAGAVWLATFDGGVSDFTLTANVTTGTRVSPHTLHQIVFRHTDANNLMMVMLGGYAANKLSLSRIVSGTETELDADATGLAASTTYEIRIEAAGTSIDVYQDDVLTLSATSSANQTATGFGSRGYTHNSADDGASRMEDIKVEA